MGLRIMVRGGGDLASGIGLRLVRAGWHVCMLELAHPLVVRRGASFAQAVYAGNVEIEGVAGRLVSQPQEAVKVAGMGRVAVLVDPTMESLPVIRPDVLVDARMLKVEIQTSQRSAQLIIGLGPGFAAGINCHAVIETRRGPNLGRVHWVGRAEADTGIPDVVGQFQSERVLRAPISGIIHPLVDIAAELTAGDPIARVDEQMITAPFTGVLRGILHAGIAVTAGMKVGDLDPRNDPSLCFRVSDKALAVAGGVLEAILSTTGLRKKMWN